MFKSMDRKLANKKGFTLAELLVVIAILAILIAIAIPVFSGMVADSNLRVNQANVHTVRSAAVTKILTHLDEHDDTGASGPLYNKGLIDPGEVANKGWVAVAEVDNAGNINNLKVYVVDDTVLTGAVTINLFSDGIYPGDKFAELVSDAGGDRDQLLAEMAFGVEDYDFAPMPDKVDTTTEFATIKPTTNGNTVYVVQAVITDLNLDD